MKLQHLKTWDDGKRITRISFLVADAPNKEECTEWLEANIALELPISRNGALLREEVLNLVRDKLSVLAAEYGRLIRPNKDGEVPQHAESK